MSNALYAASDGSWGDAASMVVVDCGKWEEVDYDLFEEVHALNVPKLAQLLWEWNDDSRSTDTYYLDQFDELGISESWVIRNSRRSEL